MIVTPVKTHKITTQDTNIFSILDKCLPQISENTIIAVTSKIISFTQGRLISINSGKKEELIKTEADWYLPRSSSKYDVMLTIKENMLAANAGVDESNADENFVLWPENMQETANSIREHLAQKFKLKNVGVVITDSKASPLKWGVTGTSLAHSGFAALKNYIGEKDLFGRSFNFEKLNIAESLAAVAVLVMGEGAEQTPLAVVTDIPMVKFVDRNPTEEELKALIIDRKDDLYAPLLTSVKWEKGKK